LLFRCFVLQGDSSSVIKINFSLEPKKKRSRRLPRKKIHA